MNTGFPTQGGPPQGGNLAGIDTSNTEPEVGFEPMPAGKYPVMITASEIKQTKAGTGGYLQLRFDVIDGQFKGRVLFDRLNLWNPNEKAVSIAKSSLKAIEMALGLQGGVGDSSELHDKPLVANVKYKPASGNFDAGNEIKGYEAYTAHAPVQQQQAAQGSPSGMPWQTAPKDDDMPF